MTETRTMSFHQHAGLMALADTYDMFLCDLWGVIHNGQTAYDGVLEALRHLQARQKIIVFISNVPRPHKDALGVVDRVGVPRDAYTDLVTSADAARHALTQKADPFHAQLGETYYALGAGRYGHTLEGLAFTQVFDVHDADWILNCGPDKDETPDDYIPIFREALKRHLPMVGVNPDRRVMHGDAFEYCAGALCARYSDMGGEFVEHGKPHPVIYDLALSLHPDVPKDRAIMIGDTLHTDIDGAKRVGLDSALVTHGIHAPDLDIPLGGGVMAHREALDRLFAQEGTTPDHVLPAFVWGNE